MATSLGNEDISIEENGIDRRERREETDDDEVYSEDEGPVPTSLIRRNNIIVSPEVVRQYETDDTNRTAKHNGWFKKIFQCFDFHSI